MSQGKVVRGDIIRVLSLGANVEQDDVIRGSVDGAMLW